MTSLFEPQHERLQLLDSQFNHAISTICSISECGVIIHSFHDFRTKYANLDQVYTTIDDTIRAYMNIAIDLYYKIINFTDSHIKSEELIRIKNIQCTVDSHDSIFESTKRHVLDLINKDLSMIEFDLDAQSLLALNPSSFTALSKSASSSHVELTVTPSPSSDTSSNNSADHLSSQSLDESIPIMEEQTITLKSESITICGSVGDDSNIQSIPISHDSDLVIQTIENSSFKVPQALSSESSCTSQSTDDHDHTDHINDGYNFEQFSTIENNDISWSHKAIPIPGTAPKKKLAISSKATQTSLIRQLIPQFMSYSSWPNHATFKGWREGSRPVSIIHSTIQSIDTIIDSIAATKHPPFQLKPVITANCTTSDLTSDLVDCHTDYKKHLHDEPWPDELDHSFNCIFIVSPIQLYSHSRPSTKFLPLKHFSFNSINSHSKSFYFIHEVNPLHSTIQLISFISLRREYSDFHAIRYSSQSFINLTSIKSVPNTLNYCTAILSLSSNAICMCTFTPSV